MRTSRYFCLIATIKRMQLDCCYFEPNRRQVGDLVQKDDLTWFTTVGLYTASYGWGLTDYIGRSFIGEVNDPITVTLSYRDENGELQVKTSKSIEIGEDEKLLIFNFVPHALEHSRWNDGSGGHYYPVYLKWDFSAFKPGDMIDVVLKDVGLWFYNMDEYLSAPPSSQ